MKTDNNSSLSGRRLQLFMILFISATVTSAFVSPLVFQHSTVTTPMILPQGSSSSSNAAIRTRTWQLQVVIPGVDMALMDAAIAVVSAAAGAASQLPRIQQLEKDLDTARSALTQVRHLLIVTVLIYVPACFCDVVQYHRRCGLRRTRRRSTIQRHPLFSSLILT